MNINGGSIEGNGSVNVGVTNSGSLNPRHASNTEFGRLTINSNYTETNSANINIQLGGSTAGTNFDQVDINGNATFDGTLNVSLLNNFTPTLGSTFDVLTYDSLNSSSNLDFTGLSINSTLQFLPQWFNNKLTLQVVEKSPTNLAIAATNANQTEGNTGTQAFTFIVTRSGDITLASSASFAVTGSGTNPANAADFGGTLPTGIVNFAVGETTKTITANVSGDSIFEANETFNVTLSNPTGTILSTASTATGTITNDDAAPVFAIASAIATEGGAITFTVTRTGDAQATQSVTAATSIGASNTASASDFTTNTQTLSFAQGETSKTFTVQTTQDTLFEGNET